MASRAVRLALYVSSSSFSRRGRAIGRKIVASYYTKPKEKKGGSLQAWMVLGGVVTSIAGCTVIMFGMPEDNIEGLSQQPDKYANENVVKAYFLRTYDKAVEFKRTFSEPRSEKLLPDELPSPYQRPYTLVLGLNDLIIHTNYDRTKGWTYQKRPGVDALLVKLFDFYEIVVFTDEVAMTGDSIVNALDPNHLITYRLFRDATKYEDGQHIKDLSNLNRSLNRVIIVDVNKDAVRYQPENSVIMEKWSGDIHDKTLWDLIPFLQILAINEVEDVRPVLDYYKSQGEGNVLDTFKSVQAKLQEDYVQDHQDSQRRVSSFHGWRSRTSSPMASSGPPPPVSSGESNHRVVEARSTSSDSSQSWTEWIGSWVGWK